jgi:formylglycine-generating enzyme required for sulfatase activity
MMGVQSVLKDLRAHAEKSGDDALLDLVSAMEGKVAEGGAISVGNISNSTAVAIGNGIDIAIHQSNVPEALVAQLKELLNMLGKPAAKTLPAWTRGKSPFPGLRAFDETDAPVFFGRAAETEQLLARLSKPDCSFLMVVGASGSGKSSLVRAGLIPCLRAGAFPGSENWKIIIFTPDAFGKGDPFEVLAQALVGLNIRATAAQLRDKRSALREILEEGLGADSSAVLFIDQFEESFTRVADESLRGKFQSAISEATNSPRILTVATLRDDFYQRCVQSPVLSRLINRNADSTFALSAPGALELYEMITAPAQAASLEYEGDLAQRILKDTGSDPGALALMAFALDQLHKASGRDSKLTLQAYQSFGGVQGAIGSRAQETFEKLSEEAKKTLPHVFRELLEVNESGTATRKRAPLEQVERDAASRELTQALIQARLLTTSRGMNNSALAEVAHEALFRSWGQLKDWLEEAQDDLILLRQVRTAAEWWDKHGRQFIYLWTDERLKFVYEMQKRLEPNWMEHEKEFICLEVERLWEEIENPKTSHRRRSWIGERLDTLGDPRPGVGLVNEILPLLPKEGAKGIAALHEGEIRLWGDKPEHIGLPDIVWVKVDGGSIEIEFGLRKKQFNVKPFLIAKHPTTYKQFKSFIEAKDGFKDLRWWEWLSTDENHKSKPDEQNFKFYNHPRENVSWYDAIAFCLWLNTRLSLATLPTNLDMKNLATFDGLRLPTEWEWQWAATGKNKKYEYPWGKNWDGNKANTSECGLARTTAAGMYLAGAAKCGALDMSGNVWEWCLNEYSNLEKIALGGNAHRVVRGGSWVHGQDDARASYRYGYYSPYYRSYDYGFRLVVRPPSL